MTSLVIDGHLSILGGSRRRGFFFSQSPLSLVISRFEMTGGEISQSWQSQFAFTNKREQTGWVCWGSKAEKEAVAHCPLIQEMVYNAGASLRRQTSAGMFFS